MGRLVAVTFGWLALAAAWPACCIAQATPQPGPARLAEMKSLAREITLYPASSGRTAAAELLPDPLVRYDDPPRQIEDATLWVWGRRGRPVAALKVELYPENLRLHGLVSLAPRLIVAEGREGWQWSAQKPGLEFRPIPDSPPPGATERERLAHMKAIARRFTAHELDGPARGRVVLRLQPTPIHRYADLEAGLVDGAIFNLAYGTNPDILLLVEASKERSESAPAWRYALARLGGAELFVSLDGREVWTQASALPQSVRETYVNRIFKVTPAGD